MEMFYKLLFILIVQFLYFKCEARQYFNETAEVQLKNYTNNSYSYSVHYNQSLERTKRNNNDQPPNKKIKIESKPQSDSKVISSKTSKPATKQSVLTDFLTPDSRPKSLPVKVKYNSRDSTIVANFRKRVNEISAMHKHADGSNNWSKIIRDLELEFIDFPKSTATLLRIVRNYESDPSTVAKAWTTQEIQLLRSLVENTPKVRMPNGEEGVNWSVITPLIPGRGTMAIQNKYRKLGVQERETWSTGSWSFDEDISLSESVALFGIGVWTEISSHLKNIYEVFRSPIQCSSRWTTADPAIEKSELSTSELQRLIRLVDEFGPNWVEIAKSFPGRSPNDLGNKFYGASNKLLKQYNIKSIHHEYDKILKSFDSNSKSGTTEKDIVQKFSERFKCSTTIASFFFKYVVKHGLHIDKSIVKGITLYKTNEDSRILVKRRGAPFAKLTVEQERRWLKSKEEVRELAKNNPSLYSLPPPDFLSMVGGNVVVVEDNIIKIKEIKVSDYKTEIKKRAKRQAILAVRNSFLSTEELEEDLPDDEVGDEKGQTEEDKKISSQLLRSSIGWTVVYFVPYKDSKDVSVCFTSESTQYKALLKNYSAGSKGKGCYSLFLYISQKKHVQNPAESTVSILCESLQTAWFIKTLLNNWLINRTNYRAEVPLPISEDAAKHIYKQLADTGAVVSDAIKKKYSFQ